MEKQDRTTRTLPVKLTNSEIQMYGEEQAGLLVQIGKLEDQRRQINDAIKPRRERVDKLANSWETGVKRLIRRDTQAIVETRKIEAEENQGDMFEAEEYAHGE